MVFNQTLKKNMISKSKTQVEQVSLEFIVSNAYESFAKAVLSTRTKVLLIGGYTSEANAIKSYLTRTRPQIDRRKKLNSDDDAYVSTVEAYAAYADEYIKWIRSEGGQPLLKEALVSYCTGFENCLKSIAVAFLLEERAPTPGLGAQILIPSEDLSRSRRAISKQWSEVDGDLPKVQLFFESSIMRRRAAKWHLQYLKEIADVDWEMCSSAFQVRNALVHNLGVMHQSVSLGNLDLHASWPIELNQQAVADVAGTFLKILRTFDPMFLGL